MMPIHIDPVSEEVQAAAHGNHGTRGRPHDSEPVETAVRKEPEIPPVKMEILTKTDIEIRKLHALRRTKEYLEEQLLNEAAETQEEVSGASQGVAFSVASSHNALINTASGGVEIRAAELAAENADENAGSGAPFKTGAAISIYKTYKKETPKAWDTGDMDEKR